MLPVPHDYRAQLLDVLDGDTIRVLADTGFYGREQVDLRLLEVTAPELNEPGGPETKAFVEGWLQGRTADLRWPLLIRTEMTKVYEPTQKMTFARFIGDVYTIDTELWLNEAIRNYLIGTS